MIGEMPNSWVQMARKLGLSVIGLPHYTIWHAYEPSVDDIKHMEVCLPSCTWLECSVVTDTH